MVAWFIIAIATLAVFGFIAVSGVQNVATASDAVGRVETVRRLDAAVASLLTRASEVPNDQGTVYLPIGAANPAGQGYGLPTDLATQSMTPFGQKFVYCPFGRMGGTGAGATVTSANGSSYSVATQVSQGKTYVTGGRPPFPQLAADANIMAWVMAPRTKMSATPSCDQVTWNPTTQKFEAPDAIVRVVSRNGGAGEARATNARQITYWVAPGATGSGASPDDRSSLNTALAFYNSRLPSNMRILLYPGTYPVTDGSLNNGTNTAQTKLLFQSDGNPGTVNIDMQGTPLGSFRVPGDVTYSGITFDNETQVVLESGRSLRMINSTVPRIINYGGRVDLKGTNTLISKDNWAYVGLMSGVLDMSDSTLIIATPSGYGIYSRGASIRGENTQITFNSAGGPNYAVGFQLEAASDFSCTSCTITFNAPFDSGGIYSAGRVSLNSTTMILNVNSNGHLLRMLPGGSMNVLNSSLAMTGAGRPQYAFVDEGGRASGGNVQMRKGWSGNCWYPTGAFSESASPAVAGSHSNVLPDLAIPSMSASPTAAEVQAYTDARATNAKRLALRSLNVTDWVCNS